MWKKTPTGDIYDYLRKFSLNHYYINRIPESRIHVLALGKTVY